jgi:hypothetical protein
MSPETQAELLDRINQLEKDKKVETDLPTRKAIGQQLIGLKIQKKTLEVQLDTLRIRAKEAAERDEENTRWDLRNDD